MIIYCCCEYSIIIEGCITFDINLQMTFAKALSSDACERNIYYMRFWLTTPLAVFAQQTKKLYGQISHAGIQMQFYIYKQ